MRGSTRSDERPTKGVSTIASRPTGRQHHAGQGRGVAHVLLQPQRQQHDVAEEQRRRRAASPACRPRSCGAGTATGRRSGCSSVSSQMRNSANADHRDARRAPRSAPELNQSRSLPLSSMICSAPTQITSSPRPTPSIGTLRGRRLALAVDQSRSTNAAAMPTGTLM